VPWEVGVGGKRGNAFRGSRHTRESMTDFQNDKKKRTGLLQASRFRSLGYQLKELTEGKSGERRGRGGSREGEKWKKKICGSRKTVRKQEDGGHRGIT